MPTLPKPDIHPVVVNLVVFLLWLPPIMVLLGIGIAILGVGVNLAMSGQVPDLSAVAGAVDSELAVVAVVVAIGAIYWVLVNFTFGEDTVDATQDQIEQAADEVDEHA